MDNGSQHAGQLRAGGIHRVQGLFIGHEGMAKSMYTTVPVGVM